MLDTVNTSWPADDSPAAGPLRSVPGASGAARDTAAPCRIVVALVAAATGIPLHTLMAQNRSTAPVAAARQLAMYLAHVALGLPQSAVARAFHRDRTTVAHACRRIEDLRDDLAFDHTVGHLEACAGWAADDGSAA